MKLDLHWTISGAILPLRLEHELKLTFVLEWVARLLQLQLRQLALRLLTWKRDVVRYLAPR